MRICSFLVSLIIVSSSYAVTNTALMIDQTTYVITFPTNAAGITNFCATNSIAMVGSVSSGSNATTNYINGISNALSSRINSASNALSSRITAVSNQLDSATNTHWAAITNLQHGTPEAKWYMDYDNDGAGIGALSSTAVGVFATGGVDYASFTCGELVVTSTPTFSIVPWTNNVATNITATGTITIITNGQNLTLVGSGISAGMYRYEACSTTDYEIYCVASSNGVTASVSGTVITWDIPANVVLLSARVRWPASSGSTTFTMNMGTTDMANTSFTNRWGASFYAMREDTGAYLPTASCRLNTTEHNKLEVTGMIASPGTVINHCIFGF